MTTFNKKYLHNIEMVERTSQHRAQNMFQAVLAMENASFQVGAALDLCTQFRRWPTTLLWLDNA